MTQGVCYHGWWLPIVEEFFTLLDYSGDEDYECHKIKSVDGRKEWEDGSRSIQNGNGDNSLGFNAYLNIPGQTEPVIPVKLSHSFRAN